MKHNSKSKKRGFSLVEVLVTLSVVGVMAGIGVAGIGGTSAKAKETKSQRNAQNICSLYNNACAADAPFTDKTDKEAIVDDLISGVTGVVVTSKFQLSPMSEEEIAAALEYCRLDTDIDRMEFARNGGESAGGGEEEIPYEENEEGWSEWMNALSDPMDSPEMANYALNHFQSSFSSDEYQFRLGVNDPLMIEYRYKF